jgi:5-methylcytosine-specific restriction endonuclease McrA
MPITHLSLLSDAALLAETVRAAGAERRATADLVSLLAEVDARRLYLGQGYPSLFAWCTGALHLSEPAAYTRITAARAARRYPMIFTHLAEGDVTLTTVTLLAAHLTDENYEALLEAARHRSKREVERLVASLVPQPDIASSLRKRPSVPPSTPARRPGATALAIACDQDPSAPAAPARLETPSSKAPADDHGREPRAVLPAAPAAPPRPIVTPLASDRYLLKITLSAEAHARLDRARDLLRHVLPDGDPAVIIDRALTLLVERLETTRCAAARRPQPRPRATTTRRHVPASIRRAVWARDEGRCAFVGADGRCRETGWLELHHVVPFARGGPTTIANLELRCRAHNAYEAEQEFGAWVTRAQGLPARGGRSPRPATDSVRTESGTLGGPRAPAGDPA